LFAELVACSASCNHGRSRRVLPSDRGLGCSGFASRALDPIATAKVEKLIYQLRENYTIVIVTHNMPSQRQTEDYVIGRFG